jgi:1-acyl-sn-glycerol-3-phosphate acyltransferase
MQRLRSVLGYLAAWVFTVLYWLPLLVVGLATGGWFTRRYLAPLAHAWGRAVLGLVGVRVVVEGGELLEGAASRVVVVNHQSSLDLLWGAVITPPRAIAIGKKELIYIPVVNALWWIMGFVRVDRSDTHKALRSLSGVSARVRDGKRTLFVAPEGTRTPTGEVLPFKKGAFWIAMESGAPIVPVVVHGAFELLPRARVIPRPGVIHLRVLPPVPTAGWRREELDANIARVRDAMMDAYAALRHA